MKKFVKKHKAEIIFLSIIIVLAIIVRSFNFAQNVNFTQDQADDSYTALQALREKKPVLIGSYIAYMYQGRKLLQGPLIIYTYGFFQILGGWDPVRASYIFMLFASFMIIPLYIGLRFLFDKKTAMAMSAVYAFFPYYIDYTRFMWNPNFQFVFMPILFLLMGLYKRTPKFIWIAITGLLCGLLLQYHFQFIPITVFVMGWFYFQIRKLKKKNRHWVKNILFFAGGFMIGWLPYIAFELRHQFYNTQTALLFLRHINELDGRTNSSTMANIAYYGLSTSFIILPFIIYEAFKLKIYHYVIGLVILFCAVVSFYQYVQPVNNPFLGKARNWYIKDEETAHRIIVSERLQNFAVAHLTYDNTSSVQKFLMLRDQTPGAVYNYRTNTYLFAVSDTDDFTQFGAYEIREFVPRKIVNKWKINDYYSLYLFKKS